MYVPVNRQTSSGSDNRQQLTLKFRLTTRDEDYNDPTPSWKLKISQLECQATQSNWWKVKDIARQVFEEKAVENVKNTKYSLGKMVRNWHYNISTKT